MIRLILFSFIGVMILYIYYLFKRQLHWVLQRACHTRVKSRTDVKGTLVKDPHTGEYYVK
ncbi:hypothetical protein [Bartonella sp. WD16.2]|uniref:hypothetical protein n=1 Tax=Bartonella sp. WD16.2 TaxID=1933904 RepID=UPI000999925D|nr:hypothetical protein [Bartonella sp. WD16.2]AQX19370.1 hypothetical protein BWD162_002360 [Bartonella sp. WD16.2]